MIVHQLATRVRFATESTQTEAMIDTTVGKVIRYGLFHVDVLQRVAISEVTMHKRQRRALRQRGFSIDSLQRFIGTP
jgi:hypothetical protein